MTTTTKLKGVEVRKATHYEIGVELGEWFVKRGDEHVIGRSELAGVIKTLFREMTGENVDITTHLLSNIITKAREHLEREHKSTIITVLKKGYKLATDKEATLYATYTYKRFIKTGLTVKRRIPLIKKQYLPESLRTVFKGENGLLGQLISENRLFLERFDELKKDRKI